MRRCPILVFVALLGGGCHGLDSAPDREPEKSIGPGSVVVLDEIVNGDLECNRATVTFASGATVNGDIRATDCSLNMIDFSGNNGDIEIYGGASIIIEGISPNGGFTAVAVEELKLYDSSFNGGLIVEDSFQVTIAGNYFNGGTVTLTDDDGGATALFAVAGMEPGQTVEGCIEVTYAGTITTPADPESVMRAVSLRPGAGPALIGRLVGAGRQCAGGDHHHDRPHLCGAQGGGIE